ncbi:hypothetical protein AVEN_229187-1 [Araneus ventricosus]|uniref:Uncharacterized protein n=1 Tax=Araneus ventricosus TaxID=182803 RepID=A0A4Y2HMK2_ARAVE|nr:hypothetical protein AVEN_229187-1 [Araneus ventricosus]
MSVFRRPDLRSQRPTLSFHHQENRGLARFSPLPEKISPSILALLLFNPLLLPTGGAVKSLSTNHRQFVGGVYFSEPLLVPYLLILFLSPAVSQAGDK